MAAVSLALLLVVPAFGARKRVLTSTLTGAKVVPGPGDPDARGKAKVTVSGTRVCWSLIVKGIQRPHAAHIHLGRARDDGPAVVPLFLTPRSLERTKRGCVRARPFEAQDIAQNPGRYYVNVHNEQFENGAVRGQLARQRSRRRKASPRSVGEGRVGSVQLR